MRILLLLLLIVSCTVPVAAYRRTLPYACTRDSKGQLENGNILYMRKGQDNERRRYSCDVGYVVNVKAPANNIWFECVKKDDVWFWRSTLYTALKLTDIKCEKRAKCPAPTTKENMEYNILERYMIKPSNRQPIQGYFTGDTYDYKCKQGFNLVLRKRNDVAATTESVLDGDFLDYIDYDVTEQVPVKCSDDGTWHHTVTYECVDVTCDATRFVNISNGIITNYKDTYNYMEYLTLLCDKMFKPIEGISAVLCKSQSTFELLLDFGCEERRCQLPSRPIHGYMYYTSTVIGSTITFSCDNGYTLRGKQQWTCQDNEQWDEACVLCEGEQKGKYVVEK